MLFNSEYNSNLVNDTYLKLIDCKNNVRNRFILKVYSVVILQLLTTFILGLITYNVDTVREYVLTHPALLILSMVVMITTIIMLTCWFHTNYPINVFLMVIFTLSLSYMVGVTATSYKPEILVQAIILTLSITVLLSIFTWYNREKDFSKLGSFLFCALFILIIGTFINMVFQFKVLDTVLACFGTVIFSLYIIYDSHLIFTKYKENEWVIASIGLYLDIINLFLQLLKLLQRE